MSEQPEALRLADGMRPEAIRLADTLPRAMPSLEGAVWGQRAAAELRRLHEVNQELVEALEELAEDFRLDTNSEFATYKNPDPGGNNPAYLKARAAIRKAKGESNE